MKVYIFARLAWALPVIVLIVFINFTLTRVMPGDPLTALVGEYPVPPSYAESVRQEFGLDRSLLDQWWRYLGGLVRGNLGHSFANRQDVLPLLIERSGRSLLLMLPAIAASTIAGLALARVAARNEGKWQDRLASVVSVAGVSLPSFWLAQLLVLIFAVGLGILPAFGMSSIAPVASGWSRVADIAKHLLLPATCITVFYVATLSRVGRAKIVEELAQDYILTARSKGLPEVKVQRHAHRNARIPIVTIVGANLSGAVTGAILVETVFAWPGVGGLFFQAIGNRDYPVLTGIFLLSSISVVLLNLLVDLSYAVIDPRVRRSYGDAS